MTRLLLVGASGLAHEAVNVVRAIDPAVEMSILDDDPTRWGTDLGGVPVVGAVDTISEYPGHLVVVCVGRGTLRRSIVERVRRRGVVHRRFVTLVHPRVHVPEDCVVGAGSIVMDGVTMTAGVSVGDHVVLMPRVTLTHGTVVGDHATLCAGVSLGGDVEVGGGAYVGMNASVRERVRIGRDATLGMGSVLLSDLPPGERWVGTPARVMSDYMEAAR